MPLAANTRLGPYEIDALLGTGGMGQVYKARDTRLDRTVAIKICSGRFTERFEREARAISSLNHPHICALYDIGREDSVDFLVMEYLEGESLEARLRKGPIPIEEALRIAIQIASALDAAHRRGMVHRDLKPGNVMLTRSGAKLLDFGLAKMKRTIELSGMESTLTAQRPITAEGTIVGTLQYMSPEQLEGKEADARSDIFSFGAMLYESITGRKGFTGSSQASLIAAVMAANPPPVSTIQPMASPALDRVVRTCLAKSPDDRWQSARDLSRELEWIAESGSEGGVPAPVAAKRRSRERAAWLAAGLAAVLLVAAAAWFAIHLHNEAAPPAMARFQISAPDKMMFFTYDSVDVSPDGQRIAFTAGTPTAPNDRLFVRPLNGLATTEIPVPGIDVHNPFWSPDGRQIAFISSGVMYRVDVTGGPPITICGDCKAGAGGTWNRDGVVVFSSRTSMTTIALSRISAAGGEAKPLRQLAQGETAQLWPQFLPDGKHYLYLSVGTAPDQQGIYAASLDSNDRKFLVATNTNAAYVQGQLLFTRGDVLMAQPFDAGSLKLSGEPRPVADHIETIPLVPRKSVPSATFAASASGVIVWRQATDSSQSSLQWFDRSGKKLDTVGEPAEYYGVALSPDNSKLAASIVDPATATKAANIWIFDLRRGGTTRLTIDAAHDTSPVWSPDGARIAFTSDRSGQHSIYWKPADGSQPEQLLGGAIQGNVEDWSRDSKYLVYNYVQNPGQNARQNPVHLGVLPLADRKPVPFLEEDFTTHDGQISPNGRWIAYMSREIGMPQIFVERFDLDPSKPRGKWQISSQAMLGAMPRWRRDGKELYYSFGNKIFAVDVKTDGPSFEAGVPKLLFEVGVTGGFAGYAVASDGQRFLIPEAIDTVRPIDVVTNWR
jgi:Tol biopolymer transport system component/tRNA A-37 threonylcarbamoyl transferase component Bud32